MTLTPETGDVGRRTASCSKKEGGRGAQDEPLAAVYGGKTWTRQGGREDSSIRLGVTRLTSLVSALELRQSASGSELAADELRDGRDQRSDGGREMQEEESDIDQMGAQGGRRLNGRRLAGFVPI